MKNYGFLNRLIGLVTFGMLGSAVAPPRITPIAPNALNPHASRSRREPDPKELSSRRQYKRRMLDERRKQAMRHKLSLIDTGRGKNGNSMSPALLAQHRAAV